jgi:hypothetical protein
MTIYKAGANDSEMFRLFCQVSDSMGRAEQGMYEAAVAAQGEKESEALFLISEQIGDIKGRATDLLFEALAEADRRKLREQYREWAR